MEDKNASLKQSYFNLEGDYSNLQQKFYKLEENSSTLQDKIITMEKTEKSLHEEIEKLKQTNQNSNTNLSELKAFKEEQVQNNIVVEKQLSMHTQVTKSLQTRIEKTEEDFSITKKDCSELHERITKLEDNDNAFNTWINDSAIEKRLTACEKFDEEIQIDLKNIKKEAQMNSENIRINTSAIRTNREDIDKFSKLHNGITMEINHLKEKSTETWESMNSFISKHNENIKEMTDLVNVSQSNFSKIDLKFQDLSNLNSNFETKLRTHNENTIKNIEDLFNGQNMLGQKISELVRDVNLRQDEVKTNVSVIREENLHRLQSVADQMKYTNEKLFNLEQAHQDQLQKNTYFENFNSKINKLEEMRQQSEARAKDEVDATLSQNNKMVDQLARDFGSRFEKLEILLKQEQSALDKVSEGMNAEIMLVKGDNLKLNNKFEEVANNNRKLFNDFDANLNSKFKKFEEIHNSEFERLDTQIQESTFIQAEKVSQFENLESKLVILEKDYLKAIDETENKVNDFGKKAEILQKENKLLEDQLNLTKESISAMQTTFEKSLVSNHATLEGKFKELEEETKLNTKSLVEIEPMAKAIDGKFDGFKQQIIIENNRHFESIKSEVSSTMMKVTERNNTVEKHFETIKDNSGKIKEELQSILKQDQIEQLEKIKNIQEETDKAIKSSDLLISTVVEKIQTLEASDKTNKQSVLNLEALIGDSNSKLSNLESADLYLQESYRILTDKSTTIEKDLKQMEQTVKKTISEQRIEMESRLKLDNGHLMEEVNNLRSSINGNTNKISGKLSIFD